MKILIKAVALAAIIGFMVPALAAHADDYYYHHHHHRHWHHRKAEDIGHDERNIARDQQDIARDRAVEHEQLREGDYGAAAATHEGIENDTANLNGEYRDLNNDINR